MFESGKVMNSELVFCQVWACANYSQFGAGAFKFQVPQTSSCQIPFRVVVAAQNEASKRITHNVDQQVFRALDILDRNWGNIDSKEEPKHREMLLHKDIHLFYERGGT